MAHTLVLLRHASAESFAASDAQRALTSHGHAEARAAGTWLAGAGIAPDQTLVSDSVRTRETWSVLATAAGWAGEADVDPGLYGADTDSALDLVRLTDEQVGTLVVVGHNPTVASLVQLLDDGEGTAGTEVLRHGFPSGSAAVFDVGCRWDELEMGCARIVAFRPGEPE